MANTYNPRLAQALGQAEGNLFVDYAAPVRDVLARKEQERLKKEESDYKKAMIEAAAYQKAMKEREVVAARLARSLEDYNPAKVHPKLLKSAIYEVNNLRNIARDIINDTTISEAERSIQLEEKFNIPLKKIYQKSEQLKQSDEEFLDSGDLLSKANSGFVTDFNNIKHDPEGYDIINDFAVIKFDKFNKENQDDPKFKELITKYKKGNDIIIPLDEFDKMHKPILQSWKKYKEINDDIINSAKSMASKGLTQSQFNSEIKNAISGLRFTEQEIKSIAYDHLGKNEEAFAGYDLNNDNIFSEDELNEWVKNQLTTAAKNTYSNWFKPDIPKNTEKYDFKNLGENIAENIMSDPVSQFEEVSNAPIKYNKLDKIVTIDTGVDKDGKSLPKLNFNLNKKSDYIRFIDVMINNSSYTAAEKSKILIAAKKWIEERPNMFAKSDSKITAENILGLPKFNQ